MFKPSSDQILIVYHTMHGAPVDERQVQSRMSD